MVQAKFNQVAFATGEKFYSCTIMGTLISKNYLSSIYSRHLHGFTDNHVQSVEFQCCNMETIPQGLMRKFPNLKILSIYKLTIASISKNDLIEYKNLERFYFNDNNLEILPGNLFEGFTNLQFISFARNQLKIIEPNILDGLENLKFVNFSENPNFDKCFSIYGCYKPNATLNEVKDQLVKKYGSSLDQLKNMHELMKTNARLQNELLAISDFSYEYWQLQSRNCQLEDENNELKVSEEQLTLDKKDLTNQVQELKESEEKLKLEVAKLKSIQPQTDLAVDVTAYILHESTKDFKIIINDREFQVHKFLLAARSSTLAELFKNNPDVESLRLIDLTVDTFETILKFIYTDELPSDDNADFLNIFSAAGKLKIEKLVKFAAGKIFDKINPENALNVFKISATFGLNELKEKSFEEVKNKFKEIDFADELIENPHEVVQKIKDFKKIEESGSNVEKELDELSI